MPILFVIPRIGDPVLECFNFTTDLNYPPIMLGLGDVILPGTDQFFFVNVVFDHFLFRLGTLIGFNYAFDLGWNVKYRIYFVTSVIGKDSNIRR